MVDLLIKETLGLDAALCELESSATLSKARLRVHALLSSPRFPQRKYFTPECDGISVKLRSESLSGGFRVTAKLEDQKTPLVPRDTLRTGRHPRPQLVHSPWHKFFPTQAQARPSLEIWTSGNLECKEIPKI